MSSSEIDGFPDTNSFPGADTRGMQSMIKTRFWQLNWLVFQATANRAYKWKEERSVRTPFYDGWTYKTQEVEFRALPEEMARFQAHLMHSIYLELAEFGCGDEAKRIISSYVSPADQEAPQVKF